jgi:hypothetical protein
LYQDIDDHIFRPEVLQEFGLGPLKNFPSTEETDRFLEDHPAFQARERDCLLGFSRMEKQFLVRSLFPVMLFPPEKSDVNSLPQDIVCPVIDTNDPNQVHYLRYHSYDWQHRQLISSSTDLDADEEQGTTSLVDFQTKFKGALIITPHKIRLDLFPSKLFSVTTFPENSEFYVRLMLATSFHLLEVYDEPPFTNQRFFMRLLKNGPNILTDNLGDVLCSPHDNAIFRIYHEAFLLFASGYTAFRQLHWLQTGQCIGHYLTPAIPTDNTDENDDDLEPYSTPLAGSDESDSECEIVEEFYTPRHSDSSEHSEYFPSESSIDSESSYSPESPHNSESSEVSDYSQASNSKSSEVSYYFPDSDSDSL